MDPQDHPAYGGHDDDHNPGRASGDDDNLTGRIDNAISSARNSEKYSSEKAGKLIETGIWKRHEGSFPPSKDYKDGR